MKSLSYAIVLSFGLILITGCGSSGGGSNSSSSAPGTCPSGQVPNTMYTNNPSCVAACSGTGTTGYSGYPTTSGYPYGTSGYNNGYGYSSYGLVSVNGGYQQCTMVNNGTGVAGYGGVGGYGGVYGSCQACQMPNGGMGVYVDFNGVLYCGATYTSGYGIIGNQPEPCSSGGMTGYTQYSGIPPQGYPGGYYFQPGNSGYYWKHR